MKTSSNKRFSRKHDRKVLVAEESTKSWADSDSDSSSSSSSSSESEQEEVHCFMADQTDDDEISHSFEEATAENMSLKSSSAESSSDELEDTDILKTELRESSTQSRSAYDKFNKMSFVKADMMYNFLESVKYDNQNSPKLNENGKAGIGFSKPERLINHCLNQQQVYCSGGTTSLPAETFDLPVDGLAEVSEMPKDVIFDARSIVSLSGEPVSLSGRKNQMKFLLLCDIMAKAISVKAGSFNAITVEKFSLITAVVCSVRMNWAKILFSILKKMVTKAISVKAGSFNAITVEKFSLITAVVCSVRMNWAKILFSILKKMVTPGSKQAKGFAIQISLLLATIPTLELGESSEFPASKILTKKTVLRFVSINDRDGAEEVTGAAKQRAASKKRPATDVGAAVPKKNRTITKKSVSSLSTLEMVAVAQEAVPIQQIAEPSAVEEIRYPSADDVDLIIQQVLDETRAVDAPVDKAQSVATEEKLWFDLPYEYLVAKWESERPVVTASDTDEEIATMDVAPADGDQQVQESVAPISTDDMLSADERMSLDDIILTIPVDIPLPSSSMEITKIMMGKSIKIPGVTKWIWFLKSLPSIPANDKGKDILVEKDPIRGNPTREHYFLICADIDLLVELRAKVIDEVAQFLNSFSLKKLATINFEEMYKKEEQVLYWGETESPQVAIQRKFYILIKYRTVLVWKFLEAWRANFAPGQGSSAVDIQVIELLSDLHLCFLEELAKEARAHGLIWKKPRCSKIFEGSPRDRGAIIAETTPTLHPGAGLEQCYMLMESGLLNLALIDGLSPYWGLPHVPLGLGFSLFVLFSGNPGFTAGRGFNPAGGAPGGG
ncbi:hypothetical protein F511_40371 [Dorcoceras hygrometricum]|uniref:Uncharacterized protein n=1 Tax=Dorcoceras hygrometricum TaxID=472368 RepID=A0A2Z7AH10_9LAMI|nr:hypothetical protein F511_40371 [Dorcoceras hygrometricum]